MISHEAMATARFVSIARPVLELVSIVSIVGVDGIFVFCCVHATCWQPNEGPEFLKHVKTEPISSKVPLFFGYVAEVSEANTEATY